MPANNALKATDIGQVIKFLDGKKPLQYMAADWEAFYTDTGRKDIDRMIRTFVGRGLGHKALFGGHSGNGKSTELNRFKGNPDINATFLVIASDVAESLNPIDLEIVELLLLVIIETLTYADEHQVRLDPSLRERFAELEGTIQGSLVIEEQRQEKRESSLETSAEASVGNPGFLVKFKAKVLAKIKAQSDYRKTVRSTFRPRLNILVELLDDLLSVLHIRDKKGRVPLIVLDGLDRMSVESARKLYAQDGQTLALIQNASLLLTVPVSVIHSPESAQVQGTLGKIHVFKNLRLSNRDGKEDETSHKNKESLRQFLFKRLDKALITEEAMDMAIYYSGGVYRTLVDLVAEAAVVAHTDEQEQIGVDEMLEAVRDFKINKSRPLTRKHWLVLQDIAETKSMYSGDDDETRLQMLQGLFALEYINGDEWYDLNPLLEDALKRYQKIERQKAAKRADEAND